MFERTTSGVQRRLIFLLIADLLLLLSIAFLLKEGSSFWDVIRRSAPDIAPIALAGFALTGIIFTGAIDLSIASALALSGTVFGALVHHNVPPGIAFLGCLLSGWGIISFNGVLISRTTIPAIIITLAGLPFYRGLALVLAEMSVPGFSGNISVIEESYHAPGKQFTGLILLGGTIAAILLEGFSRQSRLWLAFGNSPEAVNLMGLNPRGIQRNAFIIGGIFFGLATLVYVTRVQAIEPARMALGFELQVIAAVILGGTNIFGGEGTYMGTLLGAIFLYLVTQALIYAGASAYLQDALTGAIILVIIAIDCALHRKAKLMEELA